MTSFYARRIFPPLMHLSLSLPSVAALREETLSGATGEVLEVGAGTGLNLPHFPPAVQRLVAVDDNPGMRPRVKPPAFPVEHRTMPGERLAFDDASFDTVVVTFTLCSIGPVMEALREMKRVLKPGGRLLFLEHVRSDDARVARWQDRLTPIQKRLAGGCHLNRDAAALIADAGFSVEKLDRRMLGLAPRVIGTLVMGSAVRGA